MTTPNRILCQWFVLCNNDADMLVQHPAFPGGVPTCQRCATKHGLEGAPLPHWEDWFKALWNAALQAVEDTPEGDIFQLGTAHPLYSLVETMHGIAEGQPAFWQEAEAGPMLGKLPEE